MAETKFFTEADVKKEALSGKKVAVIGYGSQGRAQALNLKESGVDVVVGLRKGGSTWSKAEADGWTPLEQADAVKEADVVVILVPDTIQGQLYRDVIQPNLKEGATLLFSHGFNIHYGQIEPSADLDVVMVAPKSPGQLVRAQYEIGRGVPCLVAVHQDASGQALDKALAYAGALGGAKAGVIETTFAEETETDLFGEQAVLCGGATELILAGFETLTNAGYKPEVAYFECLHELKLIVDLIYEGGISRMHDFISDTAKYGDLTRGPRVVDSQVRETMKQVLTEIQDGRFAKEWIKENEENDCKNYKSLLDEDVSHPIEKVGKELRARMSWIGE